jgi:hypothetical protein
MRFKLSRRVGHIDNVNLRAERVGDETTPACDVSITCRGTKRDIDMLFPTEEGYGKYSDLMFNKQGYYLVPFDNVHWLNRKPEGITFTLYDQVTKKTAKLTFQQSRIKDVVATFTGGKHEHVITFKIQIHPDLEKDLPRLAACQQLDREFEVEATQDDMFGTAAADAADGDPADKGGTQQDIEEEEEEEEEEE